MIANGLIYTYRVKNNMWPHGRFPGITAKWRPFAQVVSHSYSSYIIFNSGLIALSFPAVNLFLNTLCMQGFIRKDARLLAIRPLRIGSTKVRCHKFEPSSK